MVPHAQNLRHRVLFFSAHNMYVHLISEQGAPSLATRGSANAARRATSNTRRDAIGAPCVSPPLGAGSPACQTHRRSVAARCVEPWEPTAGVNGCRVGSEAHRPGRGRAGPRPPQRVRLTPKHCRRRGLRQGRIGQQPRGVPTSGRSTPRAPRPARGRVLTAT